MRTIYATDLYGDTLVVDFADSQGADLTGATFKATLTPEETLTPPPVADPAWKTVVSTVMSAAAVIKLLVTAAVFPPGHYHAWLQVSLGGIAMPVRILDDTGRPLLVQVI